MLLVVTFESNVGSGSNGTNVVFSQLGIGKGRTIWLEMVGVAISAANVAFNRLETAEFVTAMVSQQSCRSQMRIAVRSGDRRESGDQCNHNRWLHEDSSKSHFTKCALIALQNILKEKIFLKLVPQWLGNFLQYQRYNTCENAAFL